MRRRNFNATQKLQALNPTDSSEEKRRLEQEILSCGSGKSSTWEVLLWNEAV